jgi:hypothetical protein
MPQRPKKPKSPPPKPPEPLPPGCEALLSKEQIRRAIGVSLRTLNSMIAAGQYPRADVKIGLFPRWRVATHNAWVEGVCARAKGPPAPPR